MNRRISPWFGTETQKMKEARKDSLIADFSLFRSEAGTDDASRIKPRCRFEIRTGRDRELIISERIRNSHRLLLIMPKKGNYCQLFSWQLFQQGYGIFQEQGLLPHIFGDTCFLLEENYLDLFFSIYFHTNFGLNISSDKASAASLWWKIALKFGSIRSSYFSESDGITFSCEIVFIAAEKIFFC